MIETNEYNIIDLFAGAGGFSLGFSMAGYKISLCLEHDKWACDTLRFNHKKALIIENDIRNFNTASKIRAICSSTPDIIIGGPPCQGFSNANSNSDINDPRNSLFKDFSYWVKVLKPTVFVMENVGGILTKENADGVKVIEIIKSTFAELEYKVEIWQLNAADYGVPQIRERVFIVGNKLDKVIGSPISTHTMRPLEGDGLLPYINVGEAILDLPPIKAKEGLELQPYINPINSPYQRWARGHGRQVYNHVAMNHTKRSVERFSLIQSGEKISTIPDEYKVRKRGGNGELSKTHFQSNYRQLKSESISFTIPASFYSNFIHPNIPRNITAREAARLQSFPDNYVFKGKRTLISSKLMTKLGKNEDYLSQYNQIGNAVPPLLAKAIGLHLAKFLRQNIPVSTKNILVYAD